MTLLYYVLDSACVGGCGEDESEKLEEFFECNDFLAIKEEQQKNVLKSVSKTIESIKE